MGLPTEVSVVSIKTLVAGGLAFRNFLHLKLIYRKFGWIDLIRDGVASQANFYRSSVLDATGVEPEWVVFKAQISNNGGNDTLEKLLASEHPKTARLAGKNLFSSNTQDESILDFAATVVWQKMDASNKHTVDGYGWICRALGQSRNTRYRTMLEEVSKNASSRKLRRHASKSLKFLQGESQETEQLVLNTP